jgi:hypothetical protein
MSKGVCAEEYVVMRAREPGGRGGDLQGRAGQACVRNALGVSRVYLPAGALADGFNHLFQDVDTDIGAG